MNETLCRIAGQGGIPIRRVNVPWLCDVLEELNRAEISVEQALILGTYMVATARAAVHEQAREN